MKEQPYTCPTCGGALELYANGDNGPADDRWTCEACGIEYPHTQFPLPAGYVKAARATEQAQALEEQREWDKLALAAWNRWASSNNKAAQ